MANQTSDLRILTHYFCNLGRHGYSQKNLRNFSHNPYLVEAITVRYSEMMEQEADDDDQEPQLHQFRECGNERRPLVVAMSMETLERI